MSRGLGVLKRHRDGQSGGVIADSRLDQARRVRDDEGGRLEPAPAPIDEPGHITDARSSMLTAYVLGVLPPHVGAGRAS